jgi:CheY-like chemotaxis protein
MPGPDFCRAYRERGGRAPVVLVTGADPKIVQTAMEACGAAAYVRKPFDIETLLDTLERLVRP